jgi:hypothetical protein
LHFDAWLIHSTWIFFSLLPKYFGSICLHLSLLLSKLHTEHLSIPFIESLHCWMPEIQLYGMLLIKFSIVIHSFYSHLFLPVNSKHLLCAILNRIVLLNGFRNNNMVSETFEIELLQAVNHFSFGINRFVLSEKYYLPLPYYMHSQAYIEGRKHIPCFCIV